MTYRERLYENWRALGIKYAEKGFPKTRKFDNSSDGRVSKKGFETGYNEYIKAQQRQK